MGMRGGKDRYINNDNGQSSEKDKEGANLDRPAPEHRRRVVTGRHDTIATTLTIINDKRQREAN